MVFRYLCLSLLAFAALASRRSQGQGIIPDNSDASMAEIANALAQICSPGEITFKSGDPVGCQGCPSGSDYEADPTEWHLEHVTTGHYTSANQENIILGSVGCESHARNFGGSFILLRDPVKPKLLRYNPSLITTRCHKSRFADGRDFLVCQDEWGAQEWSSSFIYAIVFDEAGIGSVFSRLFETVDSARTCGEDIEGKPGGLVQSSKIKSVRFQERDGKLIGLSLRVTLGQKQLSQIERDTCQENGTAPASIPEKEYGIHFSLQGRQFKIDPASSAAFELFPKPTFPN
jgi:hypothetical protein